ncbi:MAG: thioredoxin family protein [Ignavibacteria bacterium]|nr:thioredoxin family protein [Ignavibacteria bacterium]
MKYFLLLVLLFSINILSQDKNKIIKDENSEPMLIGYCTRDAFNDSSFAWWFDPEYENYEPDSSVIEILRDKMKDVEIILVMGSWCDDSRIHVPHLYKILDEINYPTEEITLIAVNEDKKTEGDEIEGLAIDLVPTIIFYRDNSELGRIVEMPNQSLEEDMVEIVSQEGLY